MATFEKNASQRKSALIAGTALMVMALAAAFSYGLVYERLVALGDAETTWRNIQSSTMLFQAGIFGWDLILVCGIVVAWALYLFLQSINKNLSLLSAWFRLIYATILATAILNLVFVPLLLSRPDPRKQLTRKSEIASSR